MQENNLGSAPSEREVRSREITDIVARQSYGKLIAFLSATTHDLAAAEDALSDAFAAAMVDWPANGCPANPEGWLLTVARRKFIDVTRRRKSSGVVDENVERIGAILGTVPDDTEIPDRRLALMFVCTHPAIDAAIRAPLMLQVVLGLDAKAISSAFLMSPAAMGKRLVRAKEKIRHTRIPFDTPERKDLSGRLEAVLDAIYAAFSEGWTDPSSSDSIRGDLTQEALFLARLLSELVPDRAEVLGLLALMLYAESRRATRRNATGEYVPLSEQDPDSWDTAMMQEAEVLVLQMSTLASVGRYQLEAALQSAHVYRCRTGENNWQDILQLYDALLTVAPSPVVVINRSLALAEVSGVEAALNSLAEVATDERISEYQPYWAARAELLARTSDVHAAHKAYDIAIGLERDAAARRYLQRRQSLVRR